jgi:hypothetical protein
MDAAPDAHGAGALLAGRYDLGPLVGLGGTALVHRAWDHAAGCPVAVKLFRPGAALAPGCGGGRELEVLADVRHPGLVGVRGAGVDGQGRPFVVMDLVDGRSLATRLDDGPLPAASVARLGMVLADALAAVHDRGVVHRDVKPANVLIDADDRPRLTDFGIARIVDATRVTATGVVVGTAAYMAPEQVRGEAVGPPADVYSLGLVLLEAVTGRREYEGGAIESALARLNRAPLVPAGLPDPLAATLRRMTEPDPAARPTAAAVAAALRGPARPVRAAGSRRGAASRRAAPVAALAVLVTGVLAGGLTLVSPDSAAPAAVPVAAPQPAAPVPLVPAVGLPAGAPPAVADAVVVASPDDRAAAPTGGRAAREQRGFDRSAAAQRRGDGATHASSPSSPSSKEKKDGKGTSDKSTSPKDDRSGDRSGKDGGGKSSGPGKD